MSRPATIRGVARPSSGRPPRRRRSTTSTRSRRSARSARSGISTIPTTVPEARRSPGTQGSRAGGCSARGGAGRAVMRSEALIFVGATVFFTVIGLVYWFTSYEHAGAMMLAASALMGIVAGGSIWLLSRHADVRPEDRDDATIAEGAGPVGVFATQLDLAVRGRPQRRGVRQRLRVRGLARDGRRRAASSCRCSATCWKPGTRPSPASATDHQVLASSTCLVAQVTPKRRAERS